MQTYSIQVDQILPCQARVTPGLLHGARPRLPFLPQQLGHARQHIHVARAHHRKRARPALLLPHFQDCGLGCADTCASYHTCATVDGTGSNNRDNNVLVCRYSSSRMHGAEQR